jgi:hypothetical protein
MNKKLANIAERRQELVEQAARQRATLAQNIEPWRAPLALADRGLSIARYVRQNPVFMVGAVAIFGLLRRRTRVGKWLQGGLVTLQMLRSISSWLRKS